MCTEVRILKDWILRRSLSQANANPSSKCACTWENLVCFINSLLISVFQAQLKRMEVKIYSMCIFLLEELRFHTDNLKNKYCCKRKHSFSSSEEWDLTQSKGRLSENSPGRNVTWIDPWHIYRRQSHEEID